MFDIKELTMRLDRGHIGLRAVWLLFGVLAFGFAGTGHAQQVAPVIYQIDSEQSDIHWRVYKAGAFARFGHNHVIEIVEPEGSIELSESLDESIVLIEFAVSDLRIDNPELRSTYGEDFASEPTDEDIAGTKNNMLTEGVLNGDVFPVISVNGTNLSGQGPDQHIDLSIEMLGRIVELTVPVNVEASGPELHITAQFRLTHEDLGMEPFSVMMGALQVANEMDFSIDVIARAEPSVVMERPVAL